MLARWIIPTFASYRSPELVVLFTLTSLVLPFRESFARVFFVSLGLLFDPRLLGNEPLLRTFHEFHKSQAAKGQTAETRATP